MQNTFARATHSAKRARDDRVSCIQVIGLFNSYQTYSTLLMVNLVETGLDLKISNGLVLLLVKSPFALHFPIYPNFTKNPINIFLSGTKRSLFSIHVKP